MDIPRNSKAPLNSDPSRQSRQESENAEILNAQPNFIDRSGIISESKPVSSRRVSDHLIQIEKILLEKATKLRSLLHDTLHCTGLPENERLPALQSTIVKHIEALDWLIEKESLEEIIKKAELPKLPDEAQQLLQHINNINTQLRKFVDTNQISLSKLSNSEATEALKLVPDHFFDEIVKQVNSGIQEAKFSESEEVQILLNPKTGFDLAGVPENIADFFRIILTKYFDQMPLDDKRLLIMSILALPLPSTSSQKLAAMLFASGPVIQKVFQLFGQDVNSDHVADVMKELKSNIKPFPTDKAISIIERDLQKKLGSLFSRFDREPIAAASIGQTYRAVLRETDEDVVVKVLRPGLREKTVREIALLKKLANTNSTRDLVDRLEESVSEELDLRLEARNLEQGEIYQRPQKGLGIVFLTSLPTTRDVLVMEMACGTPVHQVDDQYIAPRQEALCELLKVWYDEAIFGSGFFHGDLHQGNIFFLPSPMKGYSPFGRDYQMTLIDFGNTGTLSQQEQGALIRLSLHNATGYKLGVISALKEMIDITDEQAKVITHKVAEIMQSKMNDLERIDAIMNFLIGLDIKMPKSLILFNRGKSFLEKQITENNKKIDQIDPNKKLPRADLLSLYREVMLSHPQRIAIALTPWG